MTLRARVTVASLLVLVLLALAGCPGDACHSEQPAFELRIEAGPRLDVRRVKSLAVHVHAGDFEERKTFAVNGQLDDGVTTVAVSLGRSGAGGFTAEVEIVAQDGVGTPLVDTRGTFTGSGDACNFFTLELSCTDGESSPCGVTRGECKQGARTCRGGIWGVCQGEVKPSPEECDGKDSDCDGRIDNVAAAPDCGKQLGVCAGAKKVCDGAAGWRACGESEYSAAAAKAGAQYQFPAEADCDGKDNNCDGQVDEGLTDPTGSCWDVKGVFEVADQPMDPAMLVIFGAAVKAAQVRHALLRDLAQDDSDLKTGGAPGCGSQVYRQGWVMLRKRGAGDEYQILVRGNSKPDCSGGAPTFKPLNKGSIELAPGWKIIRISPEQYGNAVGTGKVSWEVGSACRFCCYCPDGARVSIDVTVRKQ